MRSSRDSRASGSSGDSGFLSSTGIEPTSIRAIPRRRSQEERRDDYALQALHQAIRYYREQHPEYVKEWTGWLTIDGIAADVDADALPALRDRVVLGRCRNATWLICITQLLSVGRGYVMTSSGTITLEELKTAGNTIFLGVIRGAVYDVSDAALSRIRIAEEQDDDDDRQHTRGRGPK